jgi:hypothetical protein
MGMERVVCFLHFSVRVERPHWTLRMALLLTWICTKLYPGASQRRFMAARSAGLVRAWSRANARSRTARSSDRSVNSSRRSSIPAQLLLTPAVWPVAVLPEGTDGVLQLGVGDLIVIGGRNIFDLGLRQIELRLRDFDDRREAEVISTLRQLKRQLCLFK